MVYDFFLFSGHLFENNQFWTEIKSDCNECWICGVMELIIEIGL